MPNGLFKRFLFLFCLMLFSKTVQAQEFFPTQRKIEKTRIQFQNQSWKYIQSDLFEVYFFGKNENLARNTLQILEGESPRMTDLLGYSPLQKVKVFVYPSQDDLFQSNRGISFENEMDLKNYNLEKFRIEIAFQQDQQQFKNQLLKSLAEVYVHDMLFSGSVKDVLQNSLFLNVSDWFLKGVSAYVALGETPEMNQFMFQSIRNNKIRKINLATGYEAEILGQSIWSYIVKMYGKQPISNILNLTRIIRNEQSSVASTIKKPFGKFLQDWYKFYYNQNSFITGNVPVPPAVEDIFKVNVLKGERVGNFSVSPDGNLLAYSVQTATKFESFLYSFATKKKNSIFKLTINDPMGLSSIAGPSFSWSKGNALHILYSQEGKHWLTSFAPISGNKLSSKLVTNRELKDINALNFEMHPAGQKMLLKVLRNGQVDLGTYDLRRGRFSAITQDKFSESEFHWSGNGNDVYYVSNSIADSTLSDKVKSGMNALYVWQADEGVSNSIFTVQGKIKDFSIMPDSTIRFLGSNNNRTLLLNYKPKEKKIDEVQVDVGNWLDLQQTGEKLVVKKSDLLDQMLSVYSPAEFENKPSAEFVPEVDNPLDNLNLVELEKDSVTNAAVNKRNALRRARIERNAQLKAKSPSSKTNGVFDYENSFGSGGLDGYFKSDPIRGLGYALQANMNDLMENHLIQAGAFLAANLKNSDVWGEYNYLEKRTDWTVRFDRKILNQDDAQNYQRIKYNRLEVKALYPFDLRNKLAISANYATNRALDQLNFRTPENFMAYAGLKAEYQFDNTLHLDENLQEGQRIWASAEFQKKTFEPGGFVKLKFDFRKYYSVSDWLHLFGRLSSSHIIGMGSNSTLPQTILGGMDNWLFQMRENRTTPNPLGTEGIAQRDVFMSDFAGPLRGFGINKMSGNSHLLLNLEAHIQVKKLITQEQERSQFLNNLQLVAFTDIGTAWSGSSPFSRTNGFNTNDYGGKTNPFAATVTDFRNPFLMGVGVGVRTKLIGYFVKLDYATGISDGEIQPSITYLTLGHDF